MNSASLHKKVRRISTNRCSDVLLTSIPSHTYSSLTLQVFFTAFDVNTSLYDSDTYSQQFKSNFYTVKFYLASGLDERKASIDALELQNTSLLPSHIGIGFCGRIQGISGYKYRVQIAFKAHRNYTELHCVYQPEYVTIYVVSLSLFL